MGRQGGLEGPPVRRVRHLFVPAGMLIVTIVLAVTTMRGGVAFAAPPNGTAADQLIAADVAASFRQAGLPVDDLRQQPVGGSPSGPPATERESWAFCVGAAEYNPLARSGDRAE